MSGFQAKLAKVKEYGKGVDFGRVSDDYAKHRPGPPAEMYERLGRIKPWPGSRVVDAGCGVGWAAIETAARGAEAVGFDVSEHQIETARRLAAQRGLRAEFFVAKAEKTGLDGDSFDWYVASQCWHWFDAKVAAAEAMRILRPGGVIAVCAFDYQPRRSEVAGATEELILKINPGWPMAGNTGTHLAPMFDLPEAGFADLEQFSFEHLQRFTHEGWRGRMRTCNGVGSSLGADVVKKFDEDLAKMLTERFPEEPDGTIGVWHRVWVVTARKPA